MVKHDFTQQYINTCLACKEIGYVAGNLILEIFGESYGNLAAHCWELGVEHHVTVIDLLQYGQQHADIITSYNEKISKYDPSYRLIIPEYHHLQGNAISQQRYMVLMTARKFGFCVDFVTMY